MTDDNGTFECHLTLVEAIGAFLMLSPLETSMDENQLHLLASLRDHIYGQLSIDEMENLGSIYMKMRGRR